MFKKERETSEKKKGGIFKKIIIVVLALAVLGAIFGDKDKDKKPVAEEPQQKQVATEQKQEEPKGETKDTEKENLEKELEKTKKDLEEAKKELESKETQEEKREEPTDDTKIDIVIAILKDSYKGTADIDVDKENKIIKIVPKGDYKKAVTLFISTEGKEPELRKSWDKVATSIETLSESVAEVDPDYTLAMTNPLNDENLILAAMNGVIFYNVVDDFN